MHSPIRLFRCAAALALATALASAAAEETERRFHTPEGRFWTGTLVDVKGERVILRSADGKEGAIPLSKLGEPDKRYIARFVARRQEEATLGPEQIARETKLAATLADAPRDWTSADGKTLAGKLESFDGKEVQLRTVRGVFKFPADRLAEADRRLLGRWLEQSSVRIGAWPEFVKTPPKPEVTEVKETVKGWPHIFRSPHFEFRATSPLSTSVVREFAHIFETTFELVKALPVGFDPKPAESGYFVTELYDTVDAYRTAGGMEGSGGCFNPAENKIMVPLPNLGVKQGGEGKRWVVEARGDSDTLIHEITHQVTQHWHRNWPIWLNEGLAEYVQGLRYKNGRYSLKDVSGDVRDEIFKYPVQSSSFPMVPLEQLMTIDAKTWAEALASHNATYNYRSAHALMFYFLHLDGNADGSSVANFLRALNQGEEPKKALDAHLIRGRDFATLSEEVMVKLRGAGIRIEYK